MLSTAIEIAREAGRLLRDRFGKSQQVNQTEIHDLKLQIDVDCQRLIEAQLLDAFPSHSIVGEEESRGDPGAEYRWVVDPLDGTVNYAYGIPHFAVSIALQRRSSDSGLASILGGYESVVGVVYDPMRDEMFTAEKGNGASLNGQRLRVSQRARLDEAVITVGFAKSAETIELGLGRLQRLIRRVRKVRTMGSAALDIAYVASGRLDAYLEFKIRLWDIAAGILLVAEAGGSIHLEPLMELPYTYQAIISNGRVDLQITEGETRQVDKKNAPPLP